MPACAVIRPFGLPEATAAVPAAGVVMAAGAIPLDHARAEAESPGPVVGSARTMPSPYCSG